MSDTKNSQQAGRYDMLQNAAGEILIIIEYREGGPENPRLVYDGGEQALLYRSRESAFMLNSIAREARMPLKSVNEVLMVEIENDDGVTHRFRIVGYDEIFGRKDYISIDSPMARALLKKEVGDLAVVNTPAGEASWYVNAIEYVKP